MTASPLTASEIKKFAVDVGFDECRITVAKELDGYQRLLRWLAAGYDGSMAYIRNRVDAYRHPSGVHSGTQSVVMLISSYHSDGAQLAPANSDYGRVARYAASGWITMNTARSNEAYDQGAATSCAWIKFSWRRRFSTTA